jgi:Ca2+/H+ antiporter
MACAKVSLPVELLEGAVVGGTAVVGTVVGTAVGGTGVAVGAGAAHAATQSANPKSKLAPSNLIVTCIFFSLFAIKQALVKRRAVFG